MHLGAEQHGRTIRCLARFHALENRLTVMKRHKRRVNTERAKRHNPVITPLPVFIVCDEHVIGKNPSEGNVVEVYSMQT